MDILRTHKAYATLRRAHRRPWDPPCSFIKEQICHETRPQNKRCSLHPTLQMRPQQRTPRRHGLLCHYNPMGSCSKQNVGERGMEFISLFFGFWIMWSHLILNWPHPSLSPPPLSFTLSLPLCFFSYQWNMAWLWCRNIWWVSVSLHMISSIVPFQDFFDFWMIKLVF